jgi:acetylornithine/succinyldiaminopimelate/putrescine aminotransferase
MTNAELLNLLREARAHLSFRSVYAAASFQYGDKATAEKQQALVDDLHARIDAALLKELQDSATDDVTTEVEWIRAGRNSFLTTTDDTACVVELSKERWNWDARIYGDCATEAEAKEAALKAARAWKGDK